MWQAADDITQWTSMDVSAWCAGVLAKRFPGASFKKLLARLQNVHLIDGPLLLELTPADWQEAVPSLGARKTLIGEVRRLTPSVSGKGCGLDAEPRQDPPVCVAEEEAAERPTAPISRAFGEEGGLPVPVITHNRSPSSGSSQDEAFPTLSAASFVTSRLPLSAINQVAMHQVCDGAAAWPR